MRRPHAPRLRTIGDQIHQPIHLEPLGPVELKELDQAFRRSEKDLLKAIDAVLAAETEDPAKT